ncbi:MAG TPA: Holliday junction branch migration DNA helicase RuvB [Dehalococcoidia bacterium]|nr:Holliday junction branch migration DNA helicase RuvB [Dehalococcoidia bacterium]
MPKRTPAAASERILAGDQLEGDAQADTSLRPRRLDEYINQQKVKDNIAISIEAARARGEPLDHVLLYGPPGLGKTTLAYIIAAEMGVSIRVTSGPAIERTGDLAAILTSLQAGDVLFIDEIHRLSRVVEEFLYPALEESAIDWVTGKGPGARSIRLAIKPFTLIGATTRYALMSPPLRDRFGGVYRLDFHDVDALAQIIRRSASILGVPIDDAGTDAIARRARGTPRVANRLLRRVRDFAQVRADGAITGPVAEDALARLEIDHLGLDQIDERVLRTIIEKFDGGPVGLETIAASISEDADTIMDVYEPYLLQLGFIQRTPRGRQATRLAYEHLGVAPRAAAPSAQRTLFEA